MSGEICSQIHYLKLKQNVILSLTNMMCSATDSANYVEL